MSLQDLLESVDSSDGLDKILCSILNSPNTKPSWSSEVPRLLVKWLSKNMSTDIFAYVLLCSNTVKFLMLYIPHLTESEIDNVVMIFLHIDKFGLEMAAVDVDEFENDLQLLILTLWENLQELCLALNNYASSSLLVHMPNIAKEYLTIAINIQGIFFVKQLKLKAFNCLLEAHSKSTISSIKHAHHSLLNRIPFVLKDAGDYDFQTGLLETLFRLTTSSVRLRSVKSWFPEVPDEVLKLFLEIRDFDCDARKFLNAYNKWLGKRRSVYTFVASAVRIGEYHLVKPSFDGSQVFWVDFNLRGSSLMVIHELPDMSQPTEERFWESLLINEIDVKKSSLKRCNDHVTFSLIITREPKEFFNSPPPEDISQLLNNVIVIEMPIQDHMQKVIKRIFGSTLQDYIGKKAPSSPFRKSFETLSNTSGESPLHSDIEGEEELVKSDIAEKESIVSCLALEGEQTSFKSDKTSLKTVSTSCAHSFNSSCIYCVGNSSNAEITDALFSTGGSLKSIKTIMDNKSSVALESKKEKRKDKLNDDDSFTLIINKTDENMNVDICTDDEDIVIELTNANYITPCTRTISINSFSDESSLKKILGGKSSAVLKNEKQKRKVSLTGDEAVPLRINKTNEIMDIDICSNDDDIIIEPTYPINSFSPKSSLQKILKMSSKLSSSKRCAELSKSPKMLHDNANSFLSDTPPPLNAVEFPLKDDVQVKTPNKIDASKARREKKGISPGKLNSTKRVDKFSSHRECPTEKQITTPNNEIKGTKSPLKSPKMLLDNANCFLSDTQLLNAVEFHQKNEVQVKTPIKIDAAKTRRQKKVISPSKLNSSKIGDRLPLQKECLTEKPITSPNDKLKINKSPAKSPKMLFDNSNSFFNNTPPLKTLEFPQKNDVQVKSLSKIDTPKLHKGKTANVVDSGLNIFTNSKRSSRQHTAPLQSNYNNICGGNLNENEHNAVNDLNDHLQLDDDVPTNISHYNSFKSESHKKESINSNKQILKSPCKIEFDCGILEKSSKTRKSKNKSNRMTNKKKPYDKSSERKCNLNVAKNRASFRQPKNDDRCPEDISSKKRVLNQDISSDYSDEIGDANFPKENTIFSVNNPRKTKTCYSHSTKPPSRKRTASIYSDFSDESDGFGWLCSTKKVKKILDVSRTYERKTTTRQSSGIRNDKIKTVSKKIDKKIVSKAKYSSKNSKNKKMKKTNIFFSKANESPEILRNQNLTLQPSIEEEIYFDGDEMNPIKKDSEDRNNFHESDSDYKMSPVLLQMKDNKISEYALKDLMEVKSHSDSSLNKLTDNSADENDTKIVDNLHSVYRDELQNSRNHIYYIPDRNDSSVGDDRFNNEITPVFVINPKLSLVSSDCSKNELHLGSDAIPELGDSKANANEKVDEVNSNKNMYAKKNFISVLRKKEKVNESETSFEEVEIPSSGPLIPEQTPLTARSNDIETPMEYKPRKLFEFSRTAANSNDKKVVTIPENSLVEIRQNVKRIFDILSEL